LATNNTRNSIVKIEMLTPRVALNSRAHLAKWHAASYVLAD